MVLVMPRDTYPARPGSDVIGSRWPLFHRPVAEGQMLDRCRITRPVAGVFDEDAGRTVYPEPALCYADKCRVQASAQNPRTAQVGDRTVELRLYLVTVPAEVVGLRINDQVEITDCVADPDIVGRPLRILDILAGTVIWQRDLVCSEPTPTSR